MGQELGFTSFVKCFFAESKKGKETGEKPQEEIPRKDGFEPFVNPGPTENPLFVNGYNGNFAQQMQLNRKGVERVLRIAHLDGQVFLTSLSPSRQRSAEANPDGSVTGKRFLFFREKIEEDEKENSLHRVIPIPEGWRIEISDTKIWERLEGKKLSKGKLQTEFIQQFNGQLKDGIWNCVLKEKLTGEKDEYFKMKRFRTLALPTTQFVCFATLLVPLSLTTMIFAIGTTEFFYFFVNTFGDFIHQYRPRGLRKIDHKFEYFMPQVEIDKVVRAWAFLSLKGKTLVKEAKPENK